MSTHLLKRSLLAFGGILASSTLAHGQIQNGLLNYWPLDGNADDTATDVAGSAGTSTNDGSVNGTVAFTDATPELGAAFGQAGNFPGGAGNNITVADPTPATDDIDRTGADLSISVWIKANQWSTSWQAIIAHGEGNDYRIARRSDLNPVKIAYAGGTGDIETTTTYGAAPNGDGLWHHLVVTTSNGGATQLYVDGALKVTSKAPDPDKADAAIGPSTGDGQNNNVLCIGCNPDNGREFNGLIDDIAMWDRVLTEDEVKDIYDAGNIGQPLSSLFATPDDRDGDGLPDDWEDFYGLDPDDDGSTDPNNGAAGDPDNDGSSNLDEFNNKTFPNDDDSDDDNLKDGVETNNGENSYVDENNTGTDPRNPDTDGDGLDDGAEDNGGVFDSATKTGSNPTVVDTDGDTMPDGYEVDNSQDPNVDDGGLDPDTDTLTNLIEFGLGTNPLEADSDMDGLDDNVETNTGTFSDANDTGSNPLVADSDGDTLSDGDEVNVHMSDPNLTDSDGDLFSDDDEIAEGSNPNDPNSKPFVPELPEPLLYYQFNTENGTEVENLGSLATAGVLEGAATYGESIDGSFGTAFVGNRTGANDGFVRTGFTGDQLGFGSIYTAMAWVNWAGSSGHVDHMVFGQDDGSGDNNQLHHGIRDDSATNVHFGHWGNDIADAGIVVPETWTHVAWQYDGADKVVFVNGIETSRGAGTPLATSSLPVIIGAHGRAATENPSHSFNGLIDEVRVYGAVLSEAQIRDAMLPGAGGTQLAITGTGFDPTIGADGQFGITFNSRENASYRLVYSTDLIDWDNEVDDNVTGKDGSTTVLFPHPSPGVPRIFFRVETN